jgi:hypothetical protein
MNFITRAIPTESNIQYIEAFNDLCSDYAHHFLSDDEFEEKLLELNKKHAGDDTFATD